MTLIIELTPEQELRLQRAAQQQGKLPAVIVAAFVGTLPDEAGNSLSMPIDGASLFAYWQQTNALGLFADRPEDAPELARKLREEQQRFRYQEPPTVAENVEVEEA